MAVHLLETFCPALIGQYVTVAWCTPLNPILSAWPLPATRRAAGYRVACVILPSLRPIPLTSASTLAPLQYLEIVSATLFGWLVFEEAVTLATLVGTALIVTGCLLASRQEPERVNHVETTAV